MFSDGRDLFAQFSAPATQAALGLYLRREDVPFPPPAVPAKDGEEAAQNETAEDPLRREV